MNGFNVIASLIAVVVMIAASGIICGIIEVMEEWKNEVQDR